MTVCACARGVQVESEGGFAAPRTVTEERKEGVCLRGVRVRVC